MHCTLYTVQDQIYKSQRWPNVNTMKDAREYTVQCTVYIVQYTIQCTIHYTVYYRIRSEWMRSTCTDK